jgi:DNA-binding Lrp family transcriptional regulator
MGYRIAMSKKTKISFDGRPGSHPDKPRRRDRPLDEIDRRILEWLKREPRVTNKSLAQQLSISEVTVAARIRAMESDRVMKVMAQRDFRSVGALILALVDIDVLGREVEAVAEDLKHIEQVGSVSLLMGQPSLIIEIHTADLNALEDVLLNEVAKVKGVRCTSSNVIVKIIKYQSEIGDLQA